MKSNTVDMKTPVPVRISLSDAVTLYAIRTDRFKTARLSIYTMAPAHEIDSPLGTLLFGVLRRGSENYPRLSLLNKRLDDLYGTTLTVRNFLRGDDHVLSFTAEMLEDMYVPKGEQPHILEGTMALVTEMLLHPALEERGLLRPEAVAAEKKTMVDSIRAEINDTRTYAATRLRQIMCQGEPFGLSLSGSIASVESASPEAVTKLWRDRLETARWEIYYVGSLPAEQVAEMFKTVLGDFSPAPLALSDNLPHLPPHKPNRVEETFPVGQGKLCMAWSLGINDTTPFSNGKDDYAAAVVLCELLGVMQSSLLFRHVREELGLCYYCDAAFEGKKGILSVTSGIHPENRADAEEAILAVLSTICEGKLSCEDVDLAKKSLENSYRQLPDSPAAMESYWFWHDRGYTVPPEHHVARFLAVSTEDVIRVARHFTLDTVYFLNAIKASGEDEDDE